MVKPVKAIEKQSVNGKKKNQSGNGVGYQSLARLDYEGAFGSIMTVFIVDCPPIVVVGRVHLYLVVVEVGDEQVAGIVEGPVNR